MKQVYPRNLFELRETFFEKIDALNVHYKSEQNFFESLAILHFYSVYVNEEKYKELETTEWIGKHVPISVKFGSTTHFLCIPDPHHLFSLVNFALQGLVFQSKAHNKLNFLKWWQLSRKNCMEQLHNLRKGASFFFKDCDVISEEEQGFCNQLCERKELNFLMYWSFLNDTVMCCQALNSTTHDINLFKAFSLSILVEERNLERPVIMKAKVFVSSKIGEVQLVDVMSLFGGATSLDFLPKAYEITEFKVFFLTGGLILHRN